MRGVLLSGLVAGVAAGVGTTGQAPKDAPKTEAKAPGVTTAKDTPAADLTRTKSLKAKVTGEFADAPLGDVLKEFAHQAEEQTDRPVMWTYGPGFPFAQKVTFGVKGQPLEAALDQLLTKAGGGLGYLVVSKDGDKYDGWVRLTTTGERGSEKVLLPSPKDAIDALALAKKLIDAGRPAAAKPALEAIVRKYPGTMAEAEAKELLGKIEKNP
jgi:hypothetical protein